MPRGYRYVILAFVGVSLAGAAQPKEGNAPKQQNPPAEQRSERRSPPAPSPLVRAVSADDPDKGCQAGQDNRRSDLCAQWKAADAADDAARYNWWQLILGIFGMLIGGGTLYAAWMAARYAKEAARHTQTGAVAAEEAVEVTRETGRAQTRAYVHVELGGMLAHKSGEVNFGFKALNTGQSPASNFQWELLLRIDTDSGDEWEASHCGTLPLTFGELTSQSSTTFGSSDFGQSTRPTIRQEIVLDGGDVNGVLSYSYDTIFGEHISRTTHFRSEYRLETDRISWDAKAATVKFVLTKPVQTTVSERNDKQDQRED